MKTRKRLYCRILAAAAAFILCFNSIPVQAAAKKVTYKAALEQSGIVFVYDTKSVVLNKYVNGINKGPVTKGVTYKSSDAKIAEVDKSGRLTAKKAGTVKITVTYKGKKYKTSVKINGPRLTDQSRLKTIYLPKGRSTYLDLFGLKSSVEIKSITSSNSKVVKLSSKDVRFGANAAAVGKGTAVIRAKAGSKTYSVKIVVLDQVELKASDLKYTTINGRYAVTFRLKNAGRKTVTLQYDEMAVGDDYSLKASALSSKKNISIKPGKSEVITIVSGYGVKEYQGNVLPSMSIGGNVISGGHTFAVWFAVNGKESVLYTNQFNI